MSAQEHAGFTPDPAKFHEAVKAFRKRVPMSNADYDQLAADEKQRGFTVSAVAQANLVQDVFDAIDSAIDAGTSFEDFKADIGPKLADEWGGENAPAVETIFRTNILGAYSAGRHEIYSSPAVKEARPVWRFDAIEDDRIDEDCEDADGTVLPADDPWWSTHVPPLHFNCRCSFTALTPEEADDEGITEEAPEGEPDEGFGSPPADDDWAPDLSRFSPALREVLADRLR
jgi:SPP1 gp7 family putative phage head morphogenesis protein